MNNAEHYEVYRCYAADGRLLYIGCTQNFEKRLYQHRFSAPWYGEFDRAERIPVIGRTSARALEKSLIQSEGPLYNSSHNPNHRTNQEAPDGMLSFDDACRELAMSRDTLYRAIREKQIERYRRYGSRRTYLHREDVERLKLGWPRGQA